MNLAIYGHKSILTQRITMSTPIHSEPLNEQVVEVSPLATIEDKGLPPLISQAVLASEEVLDRLAMARTRRIFRIELQKRWPCDMPGHGVCLRQADTDEHVPLSVRETEIWLDELVSN